MSRLGAIEAAGVFVRRRSKPRPRDRVATLALCGALASALAPSPAGADATGTPNKAECAKANADGQALRMDGKLAAARARLEACQVAACPSIVRSDCARRLDELEHVQPTIVFDVKNAAGLDVSGASATVDGAPLADRLVGAALRVDPGEHSFTILAAGQLAVTRQLVIKEGDKDRRESIVLGSTEAAPTGLGTRKVLGLGLGGAGIAAVVVGSIFGALTFSAVNQEKRDCASASNCKHPAQSLADHASAGTDGAVSTTAFIAAGALLAGGALLFFTAPGTSRASSDSAAVLVAPRAGPGGGGDVTLRWTF